MSMAVYNNLAALNTLNKLNKNSKGLKKNLEKVASGMKINSAGDAASEYSISERMRVRIRGLDQAITNTQNTQSLMKTAEGAVSSSIEILKTMKEKAINAANDTNTDADRAIIQKELEQSIQQIDENANVTFNGKYLLNGVQEVIDDPKTAIIALLHTEFMENVLNLIDETYGLSFEDSHAYNRTISIHFHGDGEEPFPPNDYPVGYGKMIWLTQDSRDGDNLELGLHFNANQLKGIFYSSTDFRVDVQPLLNLRAAPEVAKAVMAANIHDYENLPVYVTEGAGQALVGGDYEFSTGIYNIGLADLDCYSDFDTWFSSRGYGGGGSSSANEDTKRYLGKEYGYIYFRYLANHGAGEPTDVTKRFMRALNESTGSGSSAVDGAVKLATHGLFNSNAEMVAQMKMDFASAGSGENFLRRYCGINVGDVYDVVDGDTGSLTGQDVGYSVTKSIFFITPSLYSCDFAYLPTSESSFINGLEIKWGNFKRPEKSFTFQVDTKANQSLKVGFEDLSAQGLGLMSSYAYWDGKLKTISVATKYDAKQAITQLDQALRKALDQQTTIGATCSRLEYTAGNLITANENTQSAESVIRDADMAKEMTEYTKNNVLLQASQSMLAQANQNSSSVLSLLQ